MTDAQFALWALSTKFGQAVFYLICVTWGLIIIDLFLVMLLLVHKLFGKKNNKSI